MEFLNNPWIIGIGAGVLSGFLVTLITRHLFSRRDNREYNQKIVTTNQEILYAIRPGISEGIIPSLQVLDSLIAATAAKYAVDPRDLHNSEAYADVLVKEVMDSSFLSASAKAEFCQKLAELKPSPVPTTTLDETVVAKTRRVTNIANYRQRMVSMMSAMLGIMAALMTVSVVLFKFSEDSKTELLLKDIRLVIPTALTLFTVLIATYSMWMFRFLKRKRKERHGKLLKDFSFEDSE